MRGWIVAGRGDSVERNGATSTVSSVMCAETGKSLRKGVVRDARHGVAGRGDGVGQNGAMQATMSTRAVLAVAFDASVRLLI